MTITWVDYINGIIRILLHKFLNPLDERSDVVQHLLYFSGTDIIIFITLVKNESDEIDSLPFKKSCCLITCVKKPPFLEFLKSNFTMNPTRYIV